MNKNLLGRVTALILVVLLSGGQLFIPRLPLLLAFLALMVVIKIGTNWRVSRRLFVPVALVIFILALELTRGASDAMQIVIRTANFLCALLLLNIYSIKGFRLLQNDLLVILKYLPHQTIATTVLAAIAPFLFFNIPGTVVETFLFILYHHSPETGGHMLVRPDGFFWEPGILQLYLSILLILSIHHGKPKVDILLIVIAIILTQSTTGLLNLSIILLLSLLTVFYRQRRAIWNPKVVGSLGLAVVVLTLFIGNLQEKVSGELRGSFYARNYDTLAGIEVITNNPWIGIGFTLETYLAESRNAIIELDEYSSTAFSEREGNSNGIVTLLYTMGIPLGGLMVLGLVRQQAIPRRFMATPILVFSLLSEPLTLFPVFLLLSLSGLMRRRRLKSQTAEKVSDMPNIKETLHKQPSCSAI